MNILIHIALGTHRWVKRTLFTAFVKTHFTLFPLFMRKGGATASPRGRPPRLCYLVHRVLACLRVSTHMVGFNGSRVYYFWVTAIMLGTFRRHHKNRARQKHSISHINTPRLSKTNRSRRHFDRLQRQIACNL